MPYDEPSSGSANTANTRAGAYQPPAAVILGTVSELTQKDVGGADGTTFMGLDIGS